jgi:two-component system chemotaxis sensor kinase CheA
VEEVALPEQLMTRFRTLSFEKLERIDAAWAALTRGGGSDAMEQELFRDLHTLKGDARVVGYEDVSVLCQHVEDLLFAARDRRYRVHEDVDIVLTMALQFIGMLLRKKRGAARAGIDLAGFVKQIEEVITEWLRRSSHAPQGLETPPLVRFGEVRMRLARSTHDKLSTAATNVFLEHVRAEGETRERLHAIWQTLAAELREADTVALRPWFEQHATATAALASELGKTVDVKIETSDDAVVGARVLDAIGTGIVHSLRNAIDHGIKRATGTVVLRAHVSDDQVIVTVTDDGVGIDHALVRQRAIDAGLMTADQAARVTDAEIEPIVFRPGFSTQPVVTEVSGRGVGLDAARAAIERIGGTIALASSSSGVCVTISAPRVLTTSLVSVFASAHACVRLAVMAPWRVVGEAAGDGVDPAALIGLPATRDGSARPYRFTRGGRDDLTLVCGGAPEYALAARECPTTERDLVEVVRIGDEELLLVRPELCRGAP